MKTITEQASRHQNLQLMSIPELLTNMNKEDQSVALSVQKILPQLEKLVQELAERMKKGGRLFYIGAGTSGRLGILDASEIPPTFGAPPEWVIGLIAGGDGAIRKAVEFAEDDDQQAWKDIQVYQPTALDTVVGIAASGTTPYVLGGLKDANKAGLLTGCVVCNPGSPVAKAAKIPIEVVVGPEFVTGSTRMKAGTAQKMVLNMLTTATMVQLGKVQGNKMVDMQLSNHKLVDRGIRFIVEETGVDQEFARRLLQRYGSVRTAIEEVNKQR